MTYINNPVSLFDTEHTDPNLVFFPLQESAFPVRGGEQEIDEGTPEQFERLLATGKTLRSLFAAYPKSSAAYETHFRETHPEFDKEVPRVSPPQEHPALTPEQPDWTTEKEEAVASLKSEIEKMKPHMEIFFNHHDPKEHSEIVDCYNRLYSAVYKEWLKGQGHSPQV